jgi:hypothetical protein
MRVDAVRRRRGLDPVPDRHGRERRLDPGLVSREARHPDPPDTPRVQVMTANGAVSRPLITLRSVELGGARVENLVATIDPGSSSACSAGRSSTTTSTASTRRAVS